MYTFPPSGNEFATIVLLMAFLVLIGPLFGYVARRFFRVLRPILPRIVGRMLDAVLNRFFDWLLTVLAAILMWYLFTP
jgi:hypothetical protein